MSKAFTRESDDSGDDALPLLRTQLPPGVTNFITPGGAQRLQKELAELSERKLQLTSTNAEGMDSSAAEQRKLQARIRQLQQILQSVVVTEPPAGDRERVGFGASVTVRHANKEEIRYRIVGVDESDPARDEISWLSPLARQLMGHRAGDRVRFRSPAGAEELEIVALAYE